MMDRLFDGTWIVTFVGLDAVHPNEVTKTTNAPVTRKPAADKRFFIRTSRSRISILEDTNIRVYS
jgi:hypothetical protein